jgi:hypothetical protein
VLFICAELTAPIEREKIFNTLEERGSERERENRSERMRENREREREVFIILQDSDIQYI